MSRIRPIDPAQATGHAKELLDGVQKKLGITPNLMKTLAPSPAALEAYLNFNSTLAGGVLKARFREQISVAVAQANSCEYCLSAHAALGKMAGLKPEEIEAARQSRASDGKQEAGLQFAQAVLLQKGEVSNAALAAVRGAGYSDAEIVEIVANVALNIFTNYFNQVAQTEVDFPRVPVVMAHGA